MNIPEGPVSIDKALSSFNIPVGVRVVPPRRIKYPCVAEVAGVLVHVPNRWLVYIRNIPQRMELLTIMNVPAGICFILNR